MGPWQDANTVGMEKCGNHWWFKVFKKKKSLPLKKKDIPLYDFM